MIGPTVKHIWNVDMHLLSNFGLVINSLPLGLREPISPSTKELHYYTFMLVIFYE